MDQRAKSEEQLMRKNFFRLALCAMLFALCAPANAQQTGKIFRSISTSLQHRSEIRTPQSNSIERCALCGLLVCRRAATGKGT